MVQGSSSGRSGADSNDATSAGPAGANGHQVTQHDDSNNNGSSSASTTATTTSSDDNNNSSSRGSSSWDMFDREEVVRLMIQAMNELGYSHAAHALEQESQYVLENPVVAEFRQGILLGNWDQVEERLPQLSFKSPEDLQKARFSIHQQKFLELLERRDARTALHVLRNDLTALTADPKRLNKLSSFMMCSSPDDLRQKAHWDGAMGSSRLYVLADVQQYLSATSMVLDGRLQRLLQQALLHQVAQCTFHNVRETPRSLYEDHQCHESVVPRQTLFTLTGHTDEVWYVAYSHNGQYLASASKDTNVIIWSLSLQQRVHTLSHHQKPVSFVAWSPDDLMLLSCGNDTLIKLWTTTSGRFQREFSRHTEAVTAVAWLPDNRHFVSAGLDKKIFLWDLDGNLLYSWTGARITDMAMNPEGNKFVAICQDKRILVYRMGSTTEESNIQETDTITCVSLTRDGCYALVNVASKEIHLWDLDTRRLVCKYIGQQQHRFIIRSCFGGLNESFILSGSEDAHVYLWHRQSQKLLQVLQGHSNVVNSVAWSPLNLAQFASASDDGTVRVWGPSTDRHMDDAMITTDNDSGGVFLTC